MDGEMGHVNGYRKIPFLLQGCNIARMIHIWASLLMNVLRHLKCFRKMMIFMVGFSFSSLSFFFVLIVCYPGSKMLTYKNTRNQLAVAYLDIFENG